MILWISLINNTRLHQFYAAFCLSNFLIDWIYNLKCPLYLQYLKLVDYNVSPHCFFLQEEMCLSMPSVTPPASCLSWPRLWWKTCLPTAWSLSRMCTASSTRTAGISPASSMVRFFLFASLIVVVQNTNAYSKTTLQLTCLKWILAYREVKFYIHNVKIIF